MTNYQKTQSVQWCSYVAEHGFRTPTHTLSSVYEIEFPAKDFIHLDEVRGAKEQYP
jgi:hypothetical protein